MTNESLNAANAESEGLQFSRRDFLKGVCGGLALSAIGLDCEAMESKEKDESPFDPEVQRRLLGFVAKTMDVVLDTDVISLPTVVEAETISDADFNQMIGFDTEGHRNNLFFPPSCILLLKKSKAHSLVHEYVHYIQYNYKGYTDGTTDEVEYQAVRIQNIYRERGGGAGE